MGNATAIPTENNVQPRACQVIPFRFEESEVRTLVVEEKPWFCASDVCSVLGYQNSADAIKKHCLASGIAKREMRSGGQFRTYSIINEGNLYRLICKSRKPEAMRFEQMLMDEILPTIRKTGRYEASGSISANTLQRVFQRRQVFFVLRDGKVWVSAANVCSALGIGSSVKLIRNLPEHQQCRFLKGTVNLVMIDVAGALQAVDFCQAELADEYRRWMIGVQAEMLSTDTSVSSIAQAHDFCLPQPEMSEKERVARQSLSMTRFLCHHDCDGKIVMREIPNNAVIIGMDRLAGFVADPHGVPLDIAWDIFEAAGRRIKSAQLTR